MLMLANDIMKEFGIDVLMPQVIRDFIEIWRMIYICEPPWCDDTIRPLNLGVAIPSEIARLTTLELKAQFGGEDEIMQRFLTGIKPIAEYTCALGSALFVPFTAQDGNIYISATPANQIYPVSFDEDGRLTAVVLARTRESSAKFYTLLEYRNFDVNAGIETIQYKAYQSFAPGYLGTEILVEETGLWPLLKSGVYELRGLTAPLFVYWKMPFAFPFDPNSPIGVSCYHSCLNLMEDADRQYSRYLWEYEAGEFAINVDASALDVVPGRTFGVAPLNRRIYKAVEIKDLFQEWNPTLRDSSIYSGLNNIFRQIEFRCGLSYGTLSDVNIQEKTATEIMASKQRSYATVSSIQASLELALRQLSHALCEILKIPQIEPVFAWDDSIIVDTLQEKNIFMQEISAGIRAPWEYRVAFLGETEEQAKRAIAEIDQNTMPEMEAEDEDEFIEEEKTGNSEQEEVVKEKEVEEEEKEEER